MSTRYNHLRPLAFSMNQEVVGTKKEFTAYPFWTLNFPEELKLILLKAITKSSNRPTDKIHLPIRVLNSAVRMLIPNLISIESYAGRIGVQPWLYGFISTDKESPASAEAMALLVRSWIRTSLPPTILPAVRQTLAQQVSANMFTWNFEIMNLARWRCADNNTALPYEKGTSHNGFILWPDLIAAKLAQAEFPWGRHSLSFKRVPLSPGQHGVELISWPPLEENVKGQIWPYSVLLTLTLQTVPFQEFPVLHCDIGIRRWAGPKVFLTKNAETSVYLLDQVPWIKGLQQNRCFQVAPIRWGYVPENPETGEVGGSRLVWGSDLVHLLDDLHVGKKILPDPHELANDPSRFLPRTSERLSDPSAAIVYRTGLKPLHEVGTGLMPRDRRHFAEEIAAILQPEFTFVPSYERREYAVFIPPNPFFKEKKKKSKHTAELESEGVFAGTSIERLKAMAATVSHLTLIIYYQTEEVRQALCIAIEELLGYPASLASNSIWSSQGVTITVESRRLGSLGEKLSVKDGSYATRYERQREAMNARATDIMDDKRIEFATECVGILIELDDEDKFEDDNDPKYALRIGFGRKGYHTQFITPQPDDTKLPERKKSQLDTQLKERARSSVRDLLRQFGVIGLLPAITTKSRKTKQELDQLSIPQSLHYLGIWIAKQSSKTSPTHIDIDLPVFVHMASDSWGIEVLIPGWSDWLPYSQAQLALLNQPINRTLRTEEICQFLLETLDRCLPNFGDTLLFCHAQNLRGIWKWLGNEQITKTLPKDLKQHERLRIVRLRTGDHEIPEWYAQNDQAYGFASGIFAIGDSSHVFASVREKPLTMKKLSKEASKAFSQTKPNKKTQQMETYDPRPDVRAWNPGICEITISCERPEDALMCAIVTNELRYHCASHFHSPTVYPIPLHLASLLNEYLLPLNKPLRNANTRVDEEE